MEMLKLQIDFSLAPSRSANPHWLAPVLALVEPVVVLRELNEQELVLVPWLRMSHQHRTPPPGLLQARLHYFLEVFFPSCFVEAVAMVRNLDMKVDCRVWVDWRIVLTWKTNATSLKLLWKACSNKEVMLLSKQIANELNSVNPWSWTSSPAPTEHPISRVVGVEHCCTNAFPCKPTGQPQHRKKHDRCQVC